MFPFFRLYGFDTFLMLWGLSKRAYRREGTPVCPCSTVGNTEVSLQKAALIKSVK